MDEDVFISEVFHNVDFCFECVNNNTYYANCALNLY